MNAAMKTRSKTSSLLLAVPGSALQRKCACGGSTGVSGACSECEKNHLQRKSASATESNEVPAVVREALQSPSQPLDAAARAFFEPRFGHDFSRVRIHTDARAVESVRAVNALAYTVGEHLVFGAGQYAPHSTAGQKLLAHELAHVLQQSSAAPAPVGAMDRGASDPLERAADAVAEKILSSDPTAPALSAFSHPSAATLQRYRVPAALACSEVVDWLDNNSPYKPEWAETRCTYSFNGGLTISSQNVASGVQLRGRGHNRLTVSVNCPVDRPEWSPSRRANRDAEVTAWRNMRSSLDGHENEHRRIGREWKDTLQSRFRAVDITVTGADAADARQQLVDQIQSDQQAWTDEAQAAQDAIDPFRGAILDCP
jgi:Domain of unknown function (DUF4157)/Bacterial protein of unknown function (DUF922)